MRRTSTTLATLALAALVACSSGAGRPNASSPAAGTSSAVGAVRLTVTMTDALRMEPAQLSVPRGTPITFVVTNSGAIDHEFFLGNEEEQAKHERDMAGGDGMDHDLPSGIIVGPGQTGELTFTFPESGATLAGCHIPGHYPAGMKADIKVG